MCMVPRGWWSGPRAETKQSCLEETSSTSDKGSLTESLRSLEWLVYKPRENYAIPASTDTVLLQLWRLHQNNW